MARSRNKQKEGHFCKLFFLNGMLLSGTEPWIFAHRVLTRFAERRLSAHGWRAFYCEGRGVAWRGGGARGQPARAPQPHWQIIQGPR